MRLGSALVVSVVQLLAVGVSDERRTAAMGIQNTAPPAEVTVKGEVQRPGAVAWTPQLTVRQAIDLAGGLTDRAREPFFIARMAGTLTTKWTVTALSTLRAGDIVEVTRRPTAAAGPRVNVMGAVKTPGEYILTTASNTVALAIAAAGGLASDAGADIQVWQWRTPGRDSGTISEATSQADITIAHVSRRALDEQRVPAWLLRADGEAIVVPATEPSSAAGSGHVTLTGDVPAPFDLTFTSPLTLKEALVRAGGPRPTSGGLIFLTRAGSGLDAPRTRETVTYKDLADGSLDLRLRDGDVMDVPRALFVSFHGAGRSSTLGWSAGLTLQKALDKLNQTNPSSNAPPPPLLTLGDVQVRRPMGDHFEILNASPDMVLLPNDEIVPIR